MSQLTRCIAPAIILTWLLLGGPQTAQAQPTQASAGVEFGYGSINNPLPAFFGGGDDASLIGILLHGHYGLGHGLLIGGRLPLAHVRLSDDSATSLGNLTVELNYRLSNRPRSSSWLDTSLSIGTADSNGDGRLAALSYAIFNMEDPGLYLPDTNTIRLMYRHYFGDARLRFDVQAGLQYLLIDDTDNIARIPIKLGLRAQLGDRLQGVGRFSTFWLVDAEDDEDNFLHMLEAGLNVQRVGRGEVELLIYYPLDDLYRDGYEVWGLTVAFTTNI